MNFPSCLKHPKYNGKTPPDLRCKACCNIYVLEIKRISSERAVNMVQWLESKSVKKTTSSTRHLHLVDKEKEKE